jgi:MoxR-like ATPase
MSQGSTPSHPVLEVGQRLVTEVLAPMKEAFVAKDEIIDLMGICLVGGENLFLLGPPGTAKSALVLELGRRLEGYTFSYLLTRFTEPNEIFGPFDIRKLREGELETNTEGMLPEASLVFLDELLNANSAILNSLLTVLNERVFRRGRETRALPMRMAVGASNHLPEDESLRALFDRFLLRVHCDQVPEERLPEVLHAGWALEREQEHPPRSVSMDELAALSAELPRVDLSEVHEPFVKLVLHLRNAGIELSDRRAVKLQRLVAASALLCGRTQAIPSDLWVFRHIWDELEQEEVILGIVEAAIESAEQHREDDDSSTSQDDRSHPRARKGSAPDPEKIARDLEALEAAAQDESSRGDDMQLPSDQRERIQDHLRILSNRVTWISNSVSREALESRITALWQRLAASEQE